MVQIKVPQCNIYFISVLDLPLELNPLMTIEELCEEINEEKEKPATDYEYVPDIPYLLLIKICF